MFLDPFVHKRRIQQILIELGNDNCGSLSACVVLEYMKIHYDKIQIKKDSRDGAKTKEYPDDGSSIIGVALALAKNKNISVKIFSKLTVQDFISIVKTHERPILDELLTLSNVSFHSPITIDVILSLITPTTVPIMAFNRDGDSESQHFSPLIGLTNGSFLYLPVWQTDSSDVFIDKNEFEKSCWSEQLCLLITKENKQ